MNYLNILINAFVLLIISQVIHILIWRHTRLQSPRLFLGIVFFVVPLLIVFSLYFLPKYLYLGHYLSGFTLSEWLAVYLLHSALSGGYFFLYPTAQDGSPAVRLSLYLHAQMPAGLTFAEMNKYLMSTDDLNPRINDLIMSGYLKFSKNEKLELTLLGNMSIWPFIVVGRLFGNKTKRGLE